MKYDESGAEMGWDPVERWLLAAVVVGVGLLLFAVLQLVGAVW